jgi:hypothetical protein
LPGDLVIIDVGRQRVGWVMGERHQEQHGAARACERERGAACGGSAQRSASLTRSMSPARRLLIELKAWPGGVGHRDNLGGCGCLVATVSAGVPGGFWGWPWGGGEEGGHKDIFERLVRVETFAVTVFEYGPSPARHARLGPLGRHI